MQEDCPINISPLSKSDPLNTERVVSLNYTNQDFWSLKTKLVQFIRERFGNSGSVLPNTFNDFVEGSVAVMLIENWAFIADTLSFKMDQMVNELFIDTVTEPDNAFRICQLVGFKPTPPTPASSMWTATINSALTTDLIVPAPVTMTIVAADGPINIELYPADSDRNPVFDQDIVIPAGSFVNSSIIGLEGASFTDAFTGTGETLQSYTSSKSSVIYDSLSVSVDGIKWDRVDYFTDSQPRREYRVEFDSSYRAYVMFGNNRAGLSPPKGGRIEISGRTGGGMKGNIVTGFVTRQVMVHVLGLDSNIQVNLSNYTKGDNGYDGDTIEDIRRKLPGYLRTQDRAVTGLDYKTLCDQFVTPYHGRIGKSLATLRNQGCAGNIVDIYILAAGGTYGLQEANPQLKAELAEELESKKMITDFLCLKDGQVVEVDVSVEVMLSRINRKFEQEIRASIQNKIDAFFNVGDWEYGQELRSGNLVKALSSVKQAEGFEIVFTTNEDSGTGSVMPRFFQIIRPGSIEVAFMYE
jgi:hypothetical protein